MKPEKKPINLLLCSKQKRGSGIECQYLALQIMIRLLIGIRIWKTEILNFELASAGLEVEHLTSDTDCMFIIQGRNEHLCRHLN